MGRAAGKSKRPPPRLEAISVVLQRRHLVALLAAVKWVQGRTLGRGDEDAERVRAGAIPFLEKITLADAETIRVPMSSVGAAVLSQDALTHALTGNRESIEAGYALVVAASQQWFKSDDENETDDS